MIKNIVFDMGNVLLDYNPNVILDKVCETEEEKAIIKRELFEGPEWRLGDLGTITNAERFEGVSKRVPKELHAKLKECVDHWSICMVPVESAMEFVDEVQDKGYDIYIISNAYQDFYQYFPKHFALERFKGIVVSSDIHILKPDLEIYQYFLDTYKLVPDECLFIDDLQKNVEGARAAGMQAVQFCNNYQEIKANYL